VAAARVSSCRVCTRPRAGACCTKPLQRAVTESRCREPLQIAVRESRYREPLEREREPAQGRSRSVLLCGQRASKHTNGSESRVCGGGGQGGKQVCGCSERGSVATRIWLHLSTSLYLPPTHPPTRPPTHPPARPSTRPPAHPPAHPLACSSRCSCCSRMYCELALELASACRQAGW
jgi:hypothetical protein